MMMRTEVPLTTFRTETLTVTLTLTATVMTHTHAKGQGQRSLSSKIRAETVKERDKGDCITSCANAVGKIR